MIEDQDGEDASQCLREIHAESRKSEDFRADRLQPEAEGMFVEGHKATGIVGDKKEVMPAIQHTSDSCSVERIAEAILSQLIEIHENRDEQNSPQRYTSP